MGDIRYNSGELLNILARANSVTASSTESEFAIANATDGHVGTPVVFSGSATEEIEADLAPDLYGDFETWLSASLPAGWTANHSGTGSGAEDATNFQAGAKSAAVTGGASGVGQYYIDRELPAGEEQQFLAQLRITAGSGTARVRIQCLETRRYLTAAGWQAAATDLFTSSVTGSWDSKSLTATLETYAVAGVDKLTIRQYIRCSDNCTANFDGIHIVPTWDVVSIHGHNADASQAVEVYGGAADPASNLVVTGSQPPAAPAFFIRASSRQAYRFMKIVFPAENTEQLHLGEVVLWQSKVPSKGWITAPLTRVPHQLRAGTMAGRQSGVKMGPPTRKCDLTFKPTTVAEDVELAGELIRRTDDGTHAIVLIPDDALADVIYGRVPAAEFLSTPTAMSLVRDYTISVVEDGLPTVGL